MFRPSVLLLATLLASPAIWSAFVGDSMSVTTALIRFLIALPLAALMIAAFGWVVRDYRSGSSKSTAAARLRAAARDAGSPSS
jgi:hypothetical protein